MRKILFILSINLLVTCGGSKMAVESAQGKEEKTETPQLTTPIEEKAPEIEIKEEIVDKTPQKEEAVPVKAEGERKMTSEAFNHQSWNNLLAKNVSKDGTVNYKGFKQDRTALKAYLTALDKNIPAKTWTREDKLAYWMNVYNAFTVKLIVDNYPLKSIRDIKDPWDLRFFKLGKKWYTLNDIEHRILRKMKDPRIHFGINCASFSCPPLLNKAFTAQNVNQELEKLSISFINDSKRNTITAENVRLSKIFLWFSKDFRTEGSLIQFLNKYSKITINKDAKKSFKKYNWNLNE